MTDLSSAQDQLMRMILAKWVSKPIYAAAELGIADLLAQRAMPVEELAQATQTQPEPLYRLLRALASLGIFAEGEDMRFRLTPLASLLHSGSLRSTVLSFNSGWNDRAWMHLLDGVRHGGIPFEQAFGAITLATEDLEIEMRVEKGSEERPNPTQIRPLGSVIGPHFHIFGSSSRFFS